MMLSGACMLAPPSPLAKDLRQVKQGMSQEQVETILGKYRKQDLGGNDKNAITYPLDDQSTSSLTGQRTYRARTHRGEWEYAVIDFQASRVVAIHLLR